jgi:hypothetical protein
MAKWKVGDRVLHPAHQEGPPGVGRVCAVNCDLNGVFTVKVEFDTGVRLPNGRPVTKPSMTDFPEDVLEAE